MTLRVFDTVLKSISSSYAETPNDILAAESLNDILAFPGSSTFVGVSVGLEPHEVFPQCQLSITVRIIVASSGA